MNFRSLLPWLLVGALLTSGYANFHLVRRLEKPQAAPNSLDSAWDPVGLQHLNPSSTGEKCPTLDRLELSQDQRDQIRKCSLFSLDERLDLAIKIESATAKLKDLLALDEINSDEVFALAEGISSLRAEQYKAWLGSILVVRDVLDPGQLRLLHQLESN